MPISKTLLPAAADVGAQSSTLGVMGGGQLGRMFAHAAQRLGYFTAVMDPDVASPAGLVSHVHVQADYLDEQGLAQMLKRCAAITTEFENVPAGALFTLGAHLPAAPDAESVAVCQDRAKEKAHIVRCGVPCAPHAVVETAAQLAAVPEGLLPGILKTARMGYDGKGQVRVRNRAELDAAWATLKGVPCVLEQMLALDFEISVVLARDAHGMTVHLPVQRNLHRDGILAVTEVPAPGVSAALAEEAVAAAARIADGLRYVGVLCVEFFVLQGGQLVANEMAPRPHNSGHHSIDSCDVSQFELQVRCMTGLPLVAPRLHSPAVMLNLLGDLWFDAEGRERTPDWAGVLALPGAHLHLYGKSSARKGRKMGHLTFTAATAEQARAAALQAAALLGLPAF
ncbi:5-(carboxyamino)imidazole ribonucleotide synthase [Piscinibacter sp. Jin2]|uniref:N5-carboxyaminoimidazole ribonucleotide synthase n=1 Tax=Aquariibacter lacus TaxID=2801332 RepID=A0A9X0XF06_9BURK|nr:5-(carboxyamino)imidazole ribonucleotide synthase [Piscinibacter lacus]MBL0718768.1 5-(carboxyamino)imidazole ribonucleotide synthase [Piscinibacter lacus]